MTEKAFGLIFGNPQRLLQIKERSKGFTEKCLRGAEREKIGLILTSDLFFVSKYLMEKNDVNYEKRCRKAVNEQLGGIIKFPKIPKLRNKSKEVI